MLVLSRKAGEAIVLAGNIKIQVLGIENDRVKLGVEAPPDVLVLRSELLRDQFHNEPHEQREYREPAGQPPQRFEVEVPIEPERPRPYASRQPRYIRPQNGRQN